MDGIIVAYHNGGQIFGFQYIPLADMDFALYDTAFPGTGERIFQKCVEILEVIAEQAAALFPGKVRDGYSVSSFFLSSSFLFQWGVELGRTYANVYLRVNFV
jgi:hypothetical protein